MRGLIRLRPTSSHEYRDLGGRPCRGNGRGRVLPNRDPVSSGVVRRRRCVPLRARRRGATACRRVRRPARGRRPISVRARSFSVTSRERLERVHVCDVFDEPDELDAESGREWNRFYGSLDAGSVRSQLPPVPFDDARGPPRPVRRTRSPRWPPAASGSSMSTVRTPIRRYGVTPWRPSGCSLPAGSSSSTT